MEVDLFDPSAADGPRPAWRVIEAARRRYLTGQLVLDTTPTTNVYLRDGQVYFAERTTDGGLAVRLLVEGVLTRAQMQQATLQVSGVEHLGRMFERDETIDRDAVELCIELMTDDVLTHIADVPVSSWTMKMYQRHPSGIDRWLPTRVEVITHLVESPAAADPDVATATQPAPQRATTHLTPPPPVVTGELPLVSEPAPVEHVAAADAVTDVVEVIDVIEVIEVIDVVATVDPHDAIDEIGMIDEIDESAHVTVPTPVVFAPIPAPFGAPVSTEVPAIVAAAVHEAHHEAHDEAHHGAGAPIPVPPPPAPEPPIALSPAAMEALLSGSIKDEVAEAVRRALASIDT
ncbi:MAG: hypothetical protein ACOYMR_14990 [Ilumatobacteraceae bacterium]